MKKADDERFALTGAARLWSHGVAVDWEALRGGSSARRVPLPTYPYERRRCWVEADLPSASTKSLNLDEGTLPPLSAPFYVPTWEESPLSGSRSAAAGEETWLVLVEDHPAGRDLLAVCRATGAFVIAAVAGPGFADGDEYMFDPDDVSAVHALFESVWAAGPVPERLVCALDLLPDEGTQSAEVALRTYNRLLFVAQALARVHPEALDLLAVTDATATVTGNEHGVPSGATARGVLMALPTEVPGVHCRQLDVDTRERTPRTVRAVVQEITNPQPHERVAVRGTRRWVQEYRAIANEVHDGPGLLREEGVYLITGGLGGLGLEIAKDLARDFRANLVLVGRSAIPPRTQWLALLADPATGVEVRRKVEGLQQLEALGGRVLAVSADVSDEAAMADVIRQAEEAFGRINGVVHAAGIPGGCLMEVHDAQAAAAVLEPKTAGTLVLDRLFGEELDFVALFSSIISVCGDYGHSDYAAANSFMDAFAARHDLDDTYVVSINWAGWSQVGMVADDNMSESQQALSRAKMEPVDHSLVRRRNSHGSVVRAYEGDVGPGSHWVLTDHQLDGVGVMPGTSLLEMVRVAAADLADTDQVVLSEVIFIDPLKVEHAGSISINFVPEPDQSWKFEVTGINLSGSGSRLHCSGRVGIAEPVQRATVDLAALRASLHVAVDAPDDEQQGIMTYGPRWDNVRSYWHDEEGRGLVELNLMERFRNDCTEFVLHPALVDRATSYGVGGHAGHNYLPLTYRRITVLGPVPSHCFAVQQQRSDPSRAEFIEMDVTIVDPDGVPCVVIEGYTLRSVVLSSGTDEVSEPSKVPSDRLRNVEGQTIFRRILDARPGSQVIVCPEGLFTRLAHIRSFGSAQVETAETSTGGEAGRTLTTPYIAPADGVQAVLGQLWREAMGLAQVGVDDDFFAIGGSSLVAVQLIARIGDRLSVRLGVADLFEFSTVRQLAAHIEGQLVESLTQLSDAEAEALLIAAGTA
jgi:NAD(P)-dependent dehydrogenase (short-subunit alcohol dehydrogenase family)/acyl carrier protein